MTDLFGRGPMGQKEPPPVQDRERLGKVKQMPCVVCGAPPPSDAHHCIHGRYSGKRAGDDKTIPLCKPHHQWGPDAIHNGKASWAEKFGEDFSYLERIDAALEDDVFGIWF